MADEKKITNQELTDEQANAAAGGFNSRNGFTCEVCNKDYPAGSVYFIVNGKVYCTKCYMLYNYQQDQHTHPYTRP